MHIPQVGTRLSYASHNGTVRFVGEVEGSKGIWIGVEWDDPNRGKHSGNKDGKQYFTCITPNSGSFIRPNASISYGQTFLQALSSKYIESRVSDTTEKVTLGSSNSLIEVEAVGLNKIRDKLSRLDSLREVSLDSELVAYVDDPSEIQRTCPNIKGLDLSNSLLTTWNDVARLVTGLPRLEVLSLNQTRLTIPEGSSLGLSFHKIKELRLNKTCISWSQVLQLLPSFPSLSHLELGRNLIRSLTPADIQIPNLVALNLEQNELTDFTNVMQALSIFLRLERLILSNNSFQNISQKPIDALPLNIQHLSLNGADLKTWSSIDALTTWLPKLAVLNVGSNPLFQESSSRPLTIAKIATLTTLNSSQISHAERRDAELYYLSYISKQDLSPTELGEKQYSRFMELCEVYGRPDAVQKPVETLKKRLICVQCFRVLGLPSSEALQKQAPDVEISILSSISLKVFRLKLLKSLKLSPSLNIVLWLVMENNGISHFGHLDDLNRSLDWFGMNEDCKIVYNID